MSDARTSNKGPSTVDCEVLTDIHTQIDLAEVEVVSLVQESIPKYRLRADTEFACSNQDFIETPRIDGSEFQALTPDQTRALLDYYASSSQRISQMTKTYHDISAVTRMLEDRETDLQMAVSLGQTLLENNESLRNQVTLLEHDIEQTTEMVKQLKHDLLLKERLIRFYTDGDADTIWSSSIESDTVEFQQKIRHLEHENRELRTETMRLKLESENFEQHEQAIVDHFDHALATANSEIENLQDELLKKNDQSLKQQDEIISLSKELREIHRRLNELKRENEELKVLLSITGKTRHEYETKIEDLEKNYTECLSKLQRSQSEIDLLQKTVLQTSPTSPLSEMKSQNQTVFLSPVEYANFMSLENSLQSELEELSEDPNQFCVVNKPMRRRYSRRRLPRGFSDTDGESSITDSAFSDTESISSVASSCRFCQRSPPIAIDDSNERKLSTTISSRLRLVKRLEGSHMLKRWQQLAEPSFTSCLQSIPGVYTRAEILQEVKEENEDDLFTPENDSSDRLSFSMEKHSPETPVPPITNTRRMNLVELSTRYGLTARTLDKTTLCPDFEKKFLSCSLPNRLNNRSSTTSTISDSDETDDEFDEEPATPPSSPTQTTQLHTSAVLHQVMQRLLTLSKRTIDTLATSLGTSKETEDVDHQSSSRPILTLTPPSSPTFEGPIAPTPNTAMHAMKTSTFLRVSSLNPFVHQSIRQQFSPNSPGELSTVAYDLLRGCFPKV